MFLHMRLNKQFQNLRLEYQWHHIFHCPLVPSLTDWSNLCNLVIFCFSLISFTVLGKPCWILIKNSAKEFKIAFCTYNLRPCATFLITYNEVVRLKKNSPYSTNNGWGSETKWIFDSLVVVRNGTIETGNEELP